jgi:DNA-binding MarR family transcriptional regulator
MEDPSSKAVVLRLEDQMCFPLYAASNLLNRLYRPILSDLGLTYPQYLVMLALWQQAPKTVSALGEALLLDSGTLTPLLKRMETAGLVTRERDSRDERRVQIDLTRKGDALRDQAAHIPALLAARTQVTQDQADEVRRIVRDLIAVLGRCEPNQ